jgi:hypothetical protein
VVHRLRCFEGNSIHRNLRGSGNEGFVKGSRRAVCFSEIPLSGLHVFAQPPSVEIARYRPYGIVLHKQTAFLGAAGSGGHALAIVAE